MRQVLLCQNAARPLGPQYGYRHSYKCYWREVLRSLPLFFAVRQGPAQLTCLWLCQTAKWLADTLHLFGSALAASHPDLLQLAICRIHGQRGLPLLPRWPLCHHSPFRSIAAWQLVSIARSACRIVPRAASRPMLAIHPCWSRLRLGHCRFSLRHWPFLHAK